MHTRTKKKQRKHQKPFLFDFTAQGTREDVQMCAFVQALEDAFDARKPRDRPLLPIIKALGMKRCQVYLKGVIDGKQGTNDPKLFDALFLSTFVPAYQAMARLLVSDPPGLIARLAPMTILDRKTFFRAYGVQHPDLVEAASEGKEITLPALLP